ncbi:MAG: type II toxin-antitoxin system HicB family antitoxin [Terracidiphilus sp.]
MKVDFEVGFELETDGRWIAEVSDLPGVLAYGSTREEAFTRVSALAHEVSENKSTRANDSGR